MEVACFHCRKSDDLVRNGKSRSGLQRFLCRSCKKIFQLDYLYNANQPGIHERIARLTHNGSGVRDIERCHHRCNKSSKHQFNLTSRLTLFWPIVFLLVSSREQRHDQSRG
ncbi:transposase-like zinc-binding domain-containing protein, partial [Endozoicomonas atrinae]|uniref:IS1/IS1595 family N-terminal zinc-binding domain-containing protein n=1 Tax=Endozoicomonas atrinae TaxID=1333660 RepID=UPI003B75C1A1